jgi:hypothetical protein
VCHQGKTPQNRHDPCGLRRDLQWYNQSVCPKCESYCYQTLGLIVCHQGKTRQNRPHPRDLRRTCNGLTSLYIPNANRIAPGPRSYSRAIRGKCDSNNKISVAVQDICACWPILIHATENPENWLCNISQSSPLMVRKAVLKHRCGEHSLKLARRN